jgi:hypothetical protein
MQTATETFPAETLFHLPVRPYTPIDSLNRRAAALGSPRYAQAAAHANYNGHHVTLYWNDYRRYYVADYTWAGRVVVARGGFAECLAATLREYGAGALGASACINPRADDAEAIALAEAAPEVARGKLADAPDWYTWRHVTAAECARDSATRGPVLIFDWALMQQASSRREYEALIRERHGRCYT